MLSDLEYIMNKVWNEKCDERLKDIVISMGLDQKVKAGKMVDVDDCDKFLRRVMLLMADSEYDLNHSEQDIRLLQSIYNLIEYTMYANNNEGNIVRDIAKQVFFEIVDTSRDNNEILNRFIWWMLKNCP
jgi:hypothetical protein